MIDKDIERVKNIKYITLSGTVDGKFVRAEIPEEDKQAIENVLKELETYKKIAEKWAEHIDFCPNNFEITKCEDYDNNCAKCRLEYARNEVESENNKNEI